MRKGMIVIVVGILFTFLAVVVSAFDNTVYPIYPNYNYIENEMLNSSRYTKKEEVDTDTLNYYHDNMIFRPTAEFLEYYGFLEYNTLEDDKIKVFVEKDSFSFIVYDKVNDFYYSSRPEFQGMDGKLEGNQANRRLINSGLWIEYVSTPKPEQSSIKTASLYTFAEVTFESEEDYPTSPTHPFKIKDGSYKTNNVKVKIEEKSDLIFHIEINKEVKIKFDIIVSINDGKLSFNLLNDSIEEDTTNYSVLAIRLLSYFGSTREDKTPGYMLIPEGIGALVRLNESREQTFIGRVYGDDIGYNKVYNNNVSVPLLGLIHEVNKNGFYAYADEGDEHLLLQANFYNSSSNYNRISFKFNLREMNRRIIDQAGNGRDSIVDNIVKTNYKINYVFLGSEANYVGIANDYKEVLKKGGLINEQTKTDITLNVAYLMNDVEKILIGNKKNIMTTFNDVLSIYNELKNEEIVNQNALLLGYAKEGAGASLSSMNLFDSKKNLNKLVDNFSDDDNMIYFAQNYVYATNLSKRAPNNEVAKNASKLNLTIRRRTMALDTSYKIIKPKESYQKALNDLKFFNKHNVGLYDENIGNTLFTYYDKKIYDRTVTKEYYESIALENEKLLLNSPSSYLWKYIDGYQNLELGNSQYVYYTDLVPFLPIILQGIMPIYSTYLNFNAIGQTKLLTMVDFNVYPSYIITKEDTSKLKYTASSKYYSTTYNDYKEEMVNVYNYLNEPLKTVINADLLSREIVETGIVKNTYSNGVIIYINYSSKDFNDNGVLIKAMNYKVIL